jgi:hypothetical protein
LQPRVPRWMSLSQIDRYRAVADMWDMAPLRMATGPL